MNITCTIPSFDTPMRLQNTQTPLSVRVSILPENTSVTTNTVQLLRNECSTISAEFEIPCEYDEAAKALIISTPEFNGAGCFKTVLKENGTVINPTKLAPEDKLYEWSQTVYDNLYTQIIKQAEKEDITVFIRRTNDEHAPEIIPLRSKPGALFLVDPDTEFWNVEGSTCDPKEGDTWIGLLNAKIDAAMKAGQKNIVPKETTCIVKTSNGTRCTCTNLVGGHIVFNADQVHPRKDPVDKPSGVVALLPICRKHNNLHNKSRMQTFAQCSALWLDEYEGRICN